jgi:predicted nucleotidyltransferase
VNSRQALDGRDKAAPQKGSAALERIGSSKAKFTILIGSLARRTQNSSSDIDVVRIGHKESTKLKIQSKNQAVSYIDYDIDKFMELHERGSLFLYHVFNEGLLLDGNATAWQWLKDHFRVSTDFRQEISQNRKFLKWLQTGTKYQGAVVPYLAHTCRALKNLAIFSLAQERKYVFDKGRALRKAFPRLSDDVIALLVDASNSFERLPWRPLSRAPVDQNAIGQLNRQIAAAVNLPQPNASR